jgi:hypothetical protein
MGKDCKDVIRIIQTGNPVGSKVLLLNSARKDEDTNHHLSIDVGFLCIYMYIYMCVS